ncbi:O-Glycosyl hydrolase [Catalinimonas alkaloidigena]|uniref:O-Glycosyl hydrolase n=1 Tax=Catalinimonas alkaloidigena TaxID=1075417 RepID=A0A1G9LM03_9BACT|nr:glycoside hydrolase [Catalinimonas alkaloidigena]SDL62864.1 O-Glycosyl hydrolase [Catalinimonas alkaloidigena]
MHTNFLLSLIGCGLALALASCQPPPDQTPTERSGAREITVTVDAAQTYQTLENFGASDAWACQFVGQWPEATKTLLADRLFSLDTNAQGQPQGIGLSLWRFNIGAGSAEQGAESGIGDEWRRAASFLQPDGTYDWSRQAGQQWFLQAAQQRGVEQFLAFANSPHVTMTRNRKAYSSDGLSNLAPDRYEDFAAYLTTVVQGVRQQTGIDFQYLSPVNEPQWDWKDGGQEGSPYTNAEIAQLVRTLNRHLEQAGESVKIDVAEAGKINYLYETDDKPQRGEQIAAFFSPGSDDYIGDLSHVSPTISAHSYFTTSPAGQAASMRQQVARAIEASATPLHYWMSEYCILGDNAGEIDGNGRDLGMPAALYLARVMHNDLVMAQASAWHWWLAISPYDYKDGLLYVSKTKEGGSYHESKMLWAMGNYSRFVRPGAVRVAASSSDGAVLVSSFVHPEQQQSVTVVINPGADTLSLTLDFKNADVQRVRPYITDATQSLHPADGYDARQPLILLPRSVTSLVGTLR